MQVYSLLRVGRLALWRAVIIVSVLITFIPTTVSAADDQPSVPATTAKGNKSLYLPLVQSQPPSLIAVTCPARSDRVYNLIPIEWPPTDRPDELHADLNLALRGYVETSAAKQIINVNGPSDPLAPQFPGIFSDLRTPQFTSTHRIYDWNWNCGEHGCRSDELTPREVTLLGMATTVSEAVSFPSREPQIYAGGYKVLVLYAAENRITLGYTRRDSVAPGYAVHMENLCVDPNLLLLYRQANANGRSMLPALRNGEIVGTVEDGELLVAIRDRGTFMEPRSRKDWWIGR